MKQYIKYIIFTVVLCGLFWLIDTYAVNKKCNYIDDEIVMSGNDGPRTVEDYSEEERQIYATALGFCVADIKEDYDGDEFGIVTACQYVGKDIVRVVFNSGYLSKKYTLHDVYEESKARVINASLQHGDITKKDKK